MSTVHDLLVNKGHAVLSIDPDATVLEAVQLMNEHRVGCLLVRRADDLLGILTERDLLVRVLAVSRRPEDVAVHEAMTPEVLICRPETAVAEVSLLMKNRRIRHVPVINAEGQLCGMVSIGDVNAYHVRDHESTIHVLTEYIYGRV